MPPITPKELSKLLDDIASIKSVINENKPLLKQILLPMHFRIISLLAAVAIIAISLLYHFLLDHYGNYDNIPETTRRICLILVGSSWIALAILKRILWMKSINREVHGMTFGQVIKQVYSYQFQHIWIPVFSLMFLAIFYFMYIGAERYIVVVASVASGLVYNVIGGMTRIWQYIATGYWLILTGLTPIIFPDLSALLALAFSYGGGMVLFFVISHQTDQKSGV